MIIATTLGTLTLGGKDGYSCPCALCSPHCPESEVGVHQGVDEVVHRHEPSSAGGELAEAVEDIHEHRQVVIPLKQDLFLSV